VLDCHSAAVGLLEAERHNWTANAGATLPYVTAGLDLRYLRPSPLGETVELRGVVLSADEAEIVAEVEVLWEGKTRAAAQARWKRWSPR
jgi:acyl-coenzyme A thioesterase PaaI-like protein